MTATGPLDELLTPTASRLVDQKASLVPGGRPRVETVSGLPAATLVIHRQTSCVTVEIVGSLTEVDIASLATVIDDLLTALIPGQHIRLDLQRCAGVDGAALRYLEEARELAAEKDGVLYLARVSPAVLGQIGAGHGGLLRLSWC